MKRQYLRLFSFLIGITFIVSGVLFTLVNNYKNNRKEEIEQEKILADEIGDVFETFLNKEKELSTYRDEVLQGIKEFTVFFADMPDGYDSIIPKVEQYETTIGEIDDMSSFLKEKCTKRYYVLEANDKCDAYYKNLEKTINTFIGDVTYFNSKIKDYNEWTETENNSVIATKKYDKLDEYTAKKYTDYVDLNNDEVYLGRAGE